MVIILCSIDSIDVNTQSRSFYEYCQSLWSMQISMALTEGALLIFSQFGVEKLLILQGNKPVSSVLGSRYGENVNSSYDSLHNVILPTTVSLV